MALPWKTAEGLIYIYIYIYNHHHPLVEIRTWGSGPEIFRGRLLSGPWTYVLPKLFQLARAIKRLFHFNMRLPSPPKKAGSNMLKCGVHL